METTTQNTGTIQVICKDKSFLGREINLPIHGLANIPEDGIMEMTPEAAEVMVNGFGDSWRYLEEAMEAEVQKSEAANALESKKEQIKGSFKDIDLPTLLASVDTMTVEDILALATQAGVKGHQMFKNKPEVLKTFVKNKLEKLLTEPPKAE